MADILEPEVDLLRQVLGDPELSAVLARAPGGWRSLGLRELDRMGLDDDAARVVLALQDLVRHAYPELPMRRLASSTDVGRVYGERLGGLVHEVMIAVALDGQNNFIGEVEIAAGGSHGIAVTPRDVFRPLIRMGASAFVLVHNHPSGSPTPSIEDVQMTRALIPVGEIVGIELVDHVIVGARGGSCVSMLDFGVFEAFTDEPRKKDGKHIGAHP
jgi:DNA repair protein RadC